MKCLVVDDSATMRRIVVNALKSVGMAEVAEAGDGQEALGKCDAAIDLVVTDWNMPVMGGLELVKALRANPATAKLPILMVTTRGTKEDILQAVEAGVNNYILKPFTPQLLKEKIDAVMAAQGAA
jgi:two-component system, chemotaxis family, chemotaxis protein CheY